MSSSNKRAVYKAMFLKMALERRETRQSAGEGCYPGKAENAQPC